MKIRWGVAAAGALVALVGCGAIISVAGPCRDRNPTIGQGGTLAFLCGGYLVLTGLWPFQRGAGSEPKCISM